MAANILPHPGQPKLYLPHLFTQFTPADWPGPNIPPTFPFPQPRISQYCLGAMNPPFLKFKSLSGVAIRTRDTSHTSAAALIQNLPMENRLHRVTVNKYLWENLVAYAEQSFLDAGAGQAPALASAPQQVDAIHAIRGWYIQHLNTLPGQVNSEPSIQDQIRKQLLDLIDLLIKTRYENNYNTIEPNVGQLPAQTALGERRGFLPAWGRGVYDAQHTKDQTASGYPDCVLYRSMLQYDQSAILEIKTWWSYPRRTFQNLFETGVLMAGGWVNWNTGGSVARHLLKQIWGELFFFGCKWGILTNGTQLLVYVVTTSKSKQHNELTFSQILELTDNNLYKGIAGLCFASLDMQYGSHQQPPINQDMVERMCPPQHNHPTT